VAALLERAEFKFPEGNGAPRAAPKTGAPAELTNDLVVNARDAILELWNVRGYVKMKAPERKAKLGYALDREEALGYVVASALHKPLLTAFEARCIGKRAGTLPVFEKLAGHKKRGTTASPECIALLNEAAPLSFAPPKAKPPAPTPLPEATPPTPLPPPPPPPSAPLLPAPLPPLPPPSLPLQLQPAAVSPQVQVDFSDAGDCSVAFFSEKRHPEIPGFRGRPGGGGDEIYWDPARPPCVPSDHRPANLFNSREAAEAAAAAARVEQFSPYPDEDGEDDCFDEDEYELACLKHKQALRRLCRTFPELTEEQHTRPCPCGHGALAVWPWAVQTARLGFCECRMAGWELTCWRGEWINAGAPGLPW
jgi:hypothetical protein